jgi:immune inhibitor A
VLPCARQRGRPPRGWPADGASAALSEGNAPSPQGRALAKGHAKKLPKFVQKWQQARFAAADAVIRGKAAPNADGVVRLPNGTFVDYRLQGTGQIVTVLAEFTDPQAGQIAQPDRSTDNSTYWAPNFDRAHYQDMLYKAGGGSYGMPSMHDYYLQVSSGRYTVDGQVSNWVTIPHPESDYGANSRSGGAGSDNLNGPVYRVVRDALIAATSDSNAGINWDPAAVDVEDRYDCDGDGDFNEADGYVDHFQLIHAGQGEEEGGGAQGGDSIWSHRWYANFNQTEGPAGCKLGGYPVGTTGLWVGDYTTEPENGGVGVFSHEYGHDLGLPDLYDVVSGENGTGFWTIMSSGSWASDDPNAIGTKPVHQGAWEKLALGWSDLAVANLGDDKVIDLGPGEGSSKSGYQALRINLPNYSKTTTIFAPEGSDPNYYYSGSGDNLDVTMTRTLASPLAADMALTFRANYNIETDWDYAYVQANVGGTWQNINGNPVHGDEPERPELRPRDHG